MGYYIEGPTKGKAEYLIHTHGAEEVTEDFARRSMSTPQQIGVICVLEGPHWDAAGFMYDLKEFQEFSLLRDGRPKRWLLMDEDKARKLSGYGE